MPGASPRKLIILGAGPFAAEVADLASEIPGYAVTGFLVDRDHPGAGATLEGLPLHRLEDLPGLAADHAAIGGIGSTHRAEFIQRVAGAGLAFATLVHPSARISPTAVLGAGVLISAGVIVAAHARIADHVVVNRGALIGHHTRIGAFSSIGPGANIAGVCELGERCYVGMSAVVVDHLTVGSRTVIGAGAVVTKSLPAGVQALGLPARVVQEGIAGK